MMRDYYKKMPGDRKDGWKLRNVPLFFTVVPFIMRTRLDSQNYYEETLDVEPMMDFLKAHKEEMCIRDREQAADLDQGQAVFRQSVQIGDCLLSRSP